jgi:dTDP-4-dehydrorhamnose 3,5-epimerase-like enzyme
VEDPLPLKRVTDWNGDLYVLDRPELPFEVSRVFFVVAPDGALRGDHAHKKCSQLLICCSGEIEVTVESNSGVRAFHRLSIGLSLLIPPMNWTNQCFVGANSTLLVLCSDQFDEHDYIREKSTFISFQK